MIDNTINDDKTIAGGIGTMLAGRYHILRQLGEGGMGSVWLAEDRQLDNRKVAIKMLPSIVVTDKRAYQQLKSEALVSLKLVHPNIVTLRAFEENNGAPFLVMDYIEGQTLSDYLAVKGKLSEAETIKLLKPIAAALDYAHGEKVIHRDVKPSNIIIRKDGHPFILDFGIAREIQESMTRVTGRTISGTLLYMSPEQLRGAPPAPAQDVYSFAAMCYECLKGEPPFTRGEIAYQILNATPIPLIGSSHFVDSVMAGLAKKPEYRPQHCSAVLGEECICQRSAVLKKCSFGALTKKSVLVVGVVLTLCIIVSFWRTHEIPQRRRAVNEMTWEYYDEEYYDHTPEERKNSQEWWQYPIFGGIDWFNEDWTNEAEVVRREFSKINEVFRLGNISLGAKLLDQSSNTRHSVGEFLRGVVAEHNNDFKEAHRKYQLAAEGWCKEALFNLGVFYEFGIGVASDLLLASEFYKRAAIMGDSEAKKRYQHTTGYQFENSDAILLPVFQRKPWPDSSVLVKGTEFAALRDDVGRWWDVPFSKVKDFFASNANQVDGKFFFVDDSNDGKTINHYEIRHDRIRDFDTKNRHPAVEWWNGREMQFIKANDVQATRNIVLYYILVTGKDRFTQMNSGKKFEDVVTNEMLNCDEGKDDKQIYKLMTESQHLSIVNGANKALRK